MRTGWHGQPTPIPTQPPFQHRHIHKKLLKQSFFHFSTRAHGRTDGRTDRRTDKASYIVACPQPKTEKMKLSTEEKAYMRTKEREREKMRLREGPSLNFEIKEHGTLNLLVPSMFATFSAEVINERVRHSSCCSAPLTHYHRQCDLKT